MFEIDGGTIISYDSVMKNELNKLGIKNTSKDIELFNAYLEE